jgi:hypothetical protein
MPPEKETTIMVTGKARGAATKPRQGPKQDKKNGKSQTSAPPAPPAEPPPPIGHNIVSLDAQRAKFLKFQHMRQLIAAKAKLTTANGELRALRKQIKAEGSKLSQIEDMIKAQTEEGRLSMMAEMQERDEAISYFTGAKQTAFEFDTESQMSPIEHARRDGELAFYNNEACTGGRYAPGSPEHQAWIERYQDLMAQRVREGIGALAADEGGGDVADGETLATEASLTALDALGEAVAAVTGEPISEAELLAGLSGPIEEMPPEPGMPRAEWKDTVQAELRAEEQLIRHGTPIPDHIGASETGGPTFATE